MKTENKSKGFRYNGYHHYIQAENHVEHPSSISQTVEDDSYTIKELLQRFAQGNDPEINRLGVYDEDPEHEDEDFGKLSHKDIHEQELFVNDVTTNYQQRLQQQQEKKVEQIKLSKLSRKEAPTPDEPGELEGKNEQVNKPAKSEARAKSRQVNE